MDRLMGAMISGGFAAAGSFSNFVSSGSMGVSAGSFGMAGIPGVSGFSGMSGMGSTLDGLMQSVGSLPTGLPGLSGTNCCPCSSGYPSFGGGNQMAVMQQMMSMMDMFLGTIMAQQSLNGMGNTGAGTPEANSPRPVGDATGGGAGAERASGADRANKAKKKTKKKRIGKSQNLGAKSKAPSNDTKSTGDIKSFINQAARAYGSNPKVLNEMARRESNFRTGAVNNWDSNAKAGTPSKGLFQFIEPTFNSYAASAKKANPKAWAGLGKLNWHDWRQQALAASWAVAHGHGSAWSTYAASGGR